MEHKTEYEPKLTYQLQTAECPSFLEGQKQRKPTTPSEWFSSKFPQQANTYGPPILEAVYAGPDHSNRVNAVALNEDFFAAMLAGDKSLGHQLIFYLPEQQFYFLDGRTINYAPTSEQKLILLLSQYLIQCAAEMPGNVDVKDLFINLREEKNLRKIIKRAKALLAAEESFFGEKSPHKRIKGPETHTKLAKTFARECLRHTEESILTVTECFIKFNEFCEENGLDPINRHAFKPMITEIVRELYKETCGTMSWAVMVGTRTAGKTWPQSNGGIDRFAGIASRPAATADLDNEPGWQTIRDNPCPPPTPRPQNPVIAAVNHPVTAITASTCESKVVPNAIDRVHLRPINSLPFGSSASS